MSTNIYNPTTGQTGYQIPGAPLQPGWQWMSSSNSSSTPSSPTVFQGGTGQILPVPGTPEYTAAQNGTYSSTTQPATTSSTSSSQYRNPDGTLKDAPNGGSYSTTQSPGSVDTGGGVYYIPSSSNTTTSSSGNQGTTSSSITNGVVPTGNAGVDTLQTAFADSISGSLANGYKINPGLNIDQNTLAQFVQETIPQLDPKYTQNLQVEINGVNNNLQQDAAAWTKQQGDITQNYQSTLATLRDQSSMGGGGERALEAGLTNSANRSLTALDASTAGTIANELNAGGSQVGQGLPSGTAFGVSVPGGGGNANSFNIPSLYGRTLTNQGGDSVFAGSSQQGNALDFNYNPSTYQYGAIPSAYSSDFLSQLNQQAQNYQQGQIANGASSNTNASTPSYTGQTSPVSTSPAITSSTYGNSLPAPAGMVSVPGIGLVSSASAKQYGY